MVFYDLVNTISIVGLILFVFLFGFISKVNAQDLEPTKNWNVFDTINYNDIHSMKEALKNPSIPFLTDEEAVEQIYHAPNTYESEAIVKKTRSYVENRIKELSRLTDTDIQIKGLKYNARKPLRVQLMSNRIIQLATMPPSVTLSGNRINPPSGYPWLMYIKRANGQEYTENYSISKSINGQDAFCIQPGVPIGSTYYSSQSGELAGWKQEMIKSIITAYREFGGFTNDVSGYQRWIAAQLLVWENSNEPPQWVRITPNWAAGVQNWKNELAARASVIRIIPNFGSNNRTVNQGDNAVFTVQNAWGDHNLYVTSVSNGGSAYVSGANVVVNTTNATSSIITVNLVKGINPANDYPFYYWNGGSSYYQRLVTGYSNAKIQLTVNVNRSASVMVHKTGDVDSGGLSNTEFSLYRSDGTFVTKGVTNSSGDLKFNNLQYGDYYVQETKAAPGYELNSTPYRFTLNNSYSENNPYRVNVQNTYPLSATETVSDINENEVTHNTWSAASSDFLQYKIKTNTILKPNNKYLNAFSIEGNIDSNNVTVQQYHVFDQSGADVTSKFNMSSDATKVVASAKSEALTSDDFYNQSYSLVIRMLLKSDKLSASNKQNLTITKNGAVKASASNAKTVQTNDVSTDLYVRKIVVRHVDSDTNALLKTTNDAKYEGETYHYTPEKILSADGFDYKSNTVLDGTVGTQDLQLTIPYVLPVYTVDSDSIQIDTAKVSSGNLPTKLTFSHNATHADFMGDISFYVFITDITNQKEVYRKEYMAKTFGTSYDIQLPTNYLTKNQKINYAVSIKIAKNPKNDKFTTANEPLESYGFTASEKAITNNDLQNNAFHYSGVIRTFKSRSSSSVKEYHETLDGSLKLSYKIKSGYGIEPQITTTYSNELNEKYDLRLNLQFPKSFVTKEDHIEVTTLSDAYQLTMDANNQLPRMYVKKDTGAIYSSRFVDDVSNFVDGGFKLYIPIWHNLGRNPINYSFNQGSIGKNAISLNLQSTIDIYANMYATSKSSTINKDELMIKPMS